MAEAAAQTLSLMLEEQKKQLARLQEAIDDRQTITITGAQAKEFIHQMLSLSIQREENLSEQFALASRLSEEVEKLISKPS